MDILTEIDQFNYSFILLIYKLTNF